MKHLLTFPTKHWLLLLLGLAAYVMAAGQSGPGDGTYFIVNAATGRAISPVDGGINSNTRLKKFNKSGMQKWIVRKYTMKGKSGKTTTTYTVKNMSSGFYLRPHHVPENGNAIVSDKDAYSNYTIQKDGKNFIIKNVKMGGDAMFTKNTGFSDDEPWFGPDEASDDFRWQLIPAE
ncbi:hypothetical protein ABDK00_016115 [Niabella insulamsoli]|uniref:hypothetical protein n=1 Tax=Niabella insulamsoli TaxID=3144874 RepID=UPI0031FCEB56